MGDDEDRKQLKDNAGLEHTRKDVPRQDHAPPGHVGTGPSPPGPGGMSQSRRPFQSRWRTPDRQEKSQERERGAPTVPPSRDGEERRFKRREDTPEKNKQEQNRDSSRQQEDGQKKEFKRFDKGDLRREFDRSR